MQGNKRFVVCAGLALALGISAGAQAEPLIYVTGATIGTVDSSNPSVDTTPGGVGPMGYNLPDGYFAAGAKVSDDSQTLFVLGYNYYGPTGSACQLFAIDTMATNGVAGVSPVNLPYACALSATGGTADTADFDFLNGTGGPAVVDDYLVANGASMYLYQVPLSGPSPIVIPVTNSSGGAANLQAVANMGSGANSQLFGIDLGTNNNSQSVLEIVQLDLTIAVTNASTGATTNVPVTSLGTLVDTDTVTGTGTEADVAALTLPGIEAPGNVSLDYSPATGTYYLYTFNNQNLTIANGNGQVYATQSLSSGFTTAPGNTPYGAVSVVSAKKVVVYNDGNGNAGAFGPASLLPLLGLAALRRRNRVRKETA